MVKVIFLGTNGWYSTNTGNTPCILLESEKFYVVFDAGDGIHRLDRHINTKKPIIMFLSHLHLDHIIGFHILNKFNFEQKLQIFGYKGTKRWLESFINHPFTAALKDLPFEVEIFDIDEGVHEKPFKFTCSQLVHPDPCLGYQIELDNKVITYCTDTGICENLFKLAKSVDLLITECTFKTGQTNEKWPHLNPEEAARVAKESNAKKLALTHFESNIYKTMDDRKQAEDVARKTFKNTIVAYDELSIEL